MHGYMVPRTNMSQPSVQSFLHRSPVSPTHRKMDIQTELHATSVAVGCIYALHAGDVA